MISPDRRASFERQIERILASPEFLASRRLRSLLQYLAHNAVVSSASPKGYEIGVDVFERPDDFDPTTDSIVRVQAGRLRKALEHYYLTHGRNDRLVVRLPRGSYRLVGTEITEAAAGPERAQAEPPAAPARPAVSMDVAVLPFAVVGEPLNPVPALELPAAIAAALGRAAMIRGVIFDPAAQPDGPAPVASGKARYVVRGNLTLVDPDARLVLAVIETATGASVWTELYELSPHDLADRRTEVLRMIAAELRSAIYADKATKAMARHRAGRASLDDLVVGARWVPESGAISPAYFVDRLALSADALLIEPQCGAAYAIQAVSTSLLAMYDPAYDTPDLRRVAAQNASRALIWSADDADAVFTIAFYDTLVGNRQRALALARRGSQMDPFHPLSAALLLLTQGLADSSEAHMRRVLEEDRFYSASNPVRMLPLMWLGALHLARDEYELALDYSSQAFYFSYSPRAGFCVACAHVQRGETAEALAIVDQIRINWPALDLEHYTYVTLPRQFGDAAVAARLVDLHAVLAEVESAARPDRRRAPTTTSP